MRVEELESDGIGVGVQRQGDLDAKVHDHETLRPEGVRQDFDGVPDEQAGPRDGVEYAEDPDEDDHGIPSAFCGVIFVQAGTERPECQRHAHAAGGRQEHGPPAVLVDEHGHGHGDDEGQAGLAGGQTELLGGAGDAGGLVEDARVIGDDGIARPLREEAEGDEDQKPVPISFGPEKVQVAALLLGFELLGQRVFDLAVLELDGRMLRVSICVVLSENGEGFFLLVPRDQVPRRFRDEPDKHELDQRRKRLEKRGDPPGPVVE